MIKDKMVNLIEECNEGRRYCAKLSDKHRNEGDSCESAYMEGKSDAYTDLMKELQDIINEENNEQQPTN